MRRPYILSEPFRPALGLSQPNAQTVFAFFARRGRRPATVRERWDTPDSDFVDVDWLPAAPDAPHVLILHGLEGSSRAGYVSAVLRLLHRLRWGAFALNFRSCSGEPNRQLRSYHSGETGDARMVALKIRQRTRGPVFGVGFSLGANVLLRLLAESAHTGLLDAAAAVSVPFDLGLCARRLDEGPGWLAIYRHQFLRTLKAKALMKAAFHRGTMDLPRIRAVKKLVDFDELVTAPLHGFAGASDYYARSSSKDALPLIDVPTLLLTSEDDPLAPAAWLPGSACDNRLLTIVRTQRGGHVGFVAGSVLRPRFWAEEQVVAFLLSAV